MARKRINKEKSFLNIKIINILLSILILLSGAYYLIGINDLAVKGFKLQALKEETNRLNGENKELGIKITDLESYNSLNARAQALKMVAVGKIDYLAGADATVAKK